MPHRGAPAAHDGGGNHVKPGDDAHRTVRLAAFDGGEIGHGRPERTAHAHEQIEPGDPRVKALHHEDAPEGRGEIQPAVGFDALPIKGDGEQHGENGRQVLDDGRAREGNVPNGVEEEGQGHHAGEAPDEQPLAVVSQERLPLSPEPEGAQHEADRAPEEDELGRRQDGEGLDQQVGGGVEHHRLEHEDESARHPARRSVESAHGPQAQRQLPPEPSHGQVPRDVEGHGPQRLGGGHPHHHDPPNQ